MKNTLRVIIALILIAGAVYLIQSRSNPVSTVVQENGLAAATSTIDTTGWKTYTDTNRGFNFSIKYPANLTYKTIGSDKTYKTSSYSDFILGFYLPNPEINSGLSIEILHDAPKNAEAYTQELLDLSKLSRGSITTEQGPDITIAGETAHVVHTSQGNHTAIHAIFEKGDARYELIGAGEFADAQMFRTFYQSLTINN